MKFHSKSSSSFVAEIWSLRWHSV